MEIENFQKSSSLYDSLSLDLRTRYKIKPQKALLYLRIQKKCINIMFIHFLFRRVRDSNPCAR